MVGQAPPYGVVRQVCDGAARRLLLYDEVAADDEAAGFARWQLNAQVVEVGRLVVAARVQAQVEFVAVAVQAPV